MASVAEAKKTHNPLLSDIRTHLAKEIQKPNLDRRQDILHPSEMAKSDWCPRQSYYRLAGVAPTNPQAAHGFQLEAIFEEGHEIHRKWQKWLRDMGRLWGRWECAYCKASWFAASPDECPNGHDDPSWIEYREVPLRAEKKYLIAGHEDGADEALNTLIEIKSIGLGTLRIEEPALLREHQVETTDGKKVYDLDGLWKGLKRPLGSHLRQTMIYLALCREMGLLFDKVTFLYEYKATQAVKAFTVKYNPDIAEPLLDQALDIKWALEKGQPVERPPHTGTDKKVCKECPFFDECWKDSNGNQGSTPTSSDPDNSERYSRDGAEVPGGEEGAGVAGDRDARAPRTRRARLARGSDGTGRRRTHDADGPDEQLGRVHGDATGGGNGRREVRRRHTR